MITVTAVQQIRAGKEAELDMLMKHLAADVGTNEPGCLRFDYVQSSEDPLTRVVIETYHDVVAFEYHKTTPYLAEFIPHLLECLDGFPEVTIYGDVLQPAPPPSFFHVGMVVPDLERAVARFSDVLGIEFTEVGIFDIPHLEDPEPHPFKLTAACSMTEPPYYELIQAEGDGICSAEHAGRILYYGCWEPDMAGRVEQLNAQGIGIDARFCMEAGATPFALITAPDLLGARIEYVGIDSYGPMTEWVRTGRLPSGIGA